MRGRPIEHDVWVCPVCYAHREDVEVSKKKLIKTRFSSRKTVNDPDPINVLIKSGFNLLEGIERAGTMCFPSKKELLDHLETHHGVKDGHQNKFTQMLRRHRMLDSDGLIQRYIYNKGDRHILDINSFWELKYDNLHHMRDCYNSIVVAMRGMSKHNATYDTRYRPDEKESKNIWSDLVSYHEAESESDDFIVEDDQEPRNTVTHTALDNKHRKNEAGPSPLRRQAPKYDCDSDYSDDDDSIVVSDHDDQLDEPQPEPMPRELEDDDEPVRRAVPSRNASMGKNKKRRAVVLSE